MAMHPIDYVTMEIKSACLLCKWITDDGHFSVVGSFLRVGGQK